VSDCAARQVAAHYGFIKSILEQPETRARLKGKVGPRLSSPQ